MQNFVRLKFKTKVFSVFVKFPPCIYLFSLLLTYSILLQKIFHQNESFNQSNDFDFNFNHFFILHWQKSSPGLIINYYKSLQYNPKSLKIGA